MALLLLRGILGVAFVCHGLPKVRNVAAFAGMMKLPLPHAMLAAWTELLGGALLVLGLLTPLAALFLAGEMAGALPIVHIPHHDPFVSPHGPSMEPAVVYLVVMLAILLAGPGAYSLDAWLARRVTAESAPARERRRGFA